MEAYFGIIITCMLSIIGFFVVDIFVGVRKHNKIITEMDTKQKVQEANCLSTHRFLDNQILSLKEDVNNKIKDARNDIEECYTLINHNFKSSKQV